MHGYYNPTLVDGLTKPHNPGLEYDKFLYWNQRRLDANQAAIEAIGRTIQRPVNQWDQRGVSGSKNGGPDVAEGWDDWGPFYTQTYGAFFGVDGSTVEMCNDAACGGRLGSKREQYLVFYSSADFWLENRNAILDDQLEIFRRGVTGAARLNCCDDPLVAGRGFTEDQHNWMVEYPKAFLIPFVDGGRQSPRPRRPAERRRGEPAGPVAARQRGRGRTGRRRTSRGRARPSPRVVRRVHEAGVPRLRVHGPGRRTGHLRADQPALRAAGRLEPRVALGRGRLEIPADDASFNPRRRFQSSTSTSSRAACAAARPTGTP